MDSHYESVGYRKHGVFMSWCIYVPKDDPIIGPHLCTPKYTIIGSIIDPIYDLIYVPEMG